MKLITIFLIIIFSTLSFAQDKKSRAEKLDIVKKQLETIFMKDQTFRRIYVEAENKFGKESSEMEYFWEVVEHQDSLHEIAVIKIIEQHGWLGISEVGRLANTALWAVIQHGSIKSKQKYLPLLKASVLKKESQPNHYARLIDRMLINNGKLQIYGSQTTFDAKTGNPIFFEIDNPEYVNKRRKEIGLNPIEDFLKEKNIKWNIKQK